MNRIARLWHWVSPAVIGSLVLVLMSQVGNGSFSAVLLIPAVITGSLVGFTARAVKRLRPWLGVATTWVLASTVWGVVMFVVMIVPARCPVEVSEVRCTVEEASIWGVNAALVVVVLMMFIEPPKALARIARELWRRRR